MSDEIPIGPGNPRGEYGGDGPRSLPSSTGSGAKSYSVHMSQSITGPLTNWKEKDWEQATKYITRNDGTRYTPEELKRAFVAELALGHEVVPIGDCDNFDWKRGCQGHPQPPNAAMKDGAPDAGKLGVADSRRSLPSNG